MIVAPIRVMAYLSFGLMFMVLVKLATFGVSEMRLRSCRPLSMLRSLVIVLAGYILGRLLLLILGVRVKLSGYENYLDAFDHVDRKTQLIVCNHSSHLDIAVIVAMFMPSFVAVDLKPNGKMYDLMRHCVLAHHGILVNHLMDNTDGIEAITKRAKVKNSKVLWFGLVFI